jgi:uncharacterized protein (TIGR02246 family)
MVRALVVSPRFQTKLAFLIFFATVIFVAIQVVVTSAVDCSQDELAIRMIISEEVAAWNSGDATAYSRHFAAKGTFTNIYGMVFEGHDAFEKRHAETFATFFKGSARRETIRSIRFVTHDVAIVDVDTEVTGFGKIPSGVTIQSDGVLLTRLQLVLVKHGDEWWIEAYHNVDVKVYF